jgi:predicted RNA methylase
MGKVREGFRQKAVEQITREGWDIYKKLDKEEKDDWRVRKYADWFSLYSPDREKRQSIVADISIDLRLYLLCKSKQANIINFIKYFGTEIKLFESYETKLLKLVIVEEQRLKRPLTDEEQSNIYNSLLINEKEDIKRLLFENRTRSKQEKLQQYYTNDILAQQLIDLSGISYNDTHIRVLEPTAGDGALIIPILKLDKVDFDIDLIEIDKDNRAKLESITKGKNTVRVLKHKNFLTYISGAVYDYIFMNPPFHLRKGENSLMIKDTYDVDFIKRAYSMLKEGGKLCAIIGGSFKSAKEGDPLFWINANKKNKDMKITIYKLNKKKYSGVMVANTFIVIIDKLKIIPKEDDDILAIKFYDEKELESIGADVESGKLNIKDIPKQLEALTPTESLKKTLKGLSRKRR